MSEKFKTSDADFKYFSDRGRYWQRLFGLLDWEIVYMHKNDPGALAWCQADFESRGCVIGLSVDRTTKPTKESLDLAVFHEIRYTGKWRYVVPTLWTL